jgi:hypothetical protein
MDWEDAFSTKVGMAGKKPLLTIHARVRMGSTSD